VTIEDRNLKAGTKLVGRYKGTIYHAEVVETKEGVRYRLSEAPFSEFKSLSAAGSQIMGGSACNGWRFWSVEGSDEAKPKPKGGKPRASGKKGNDNGSVAAGGLLVRGEEEGRWLCMLCEESFDAPKDIVPEGCPNGHTADDAKEKATA
jgi:hypothetical protein